MRLFRIALLMGVFIMFTNTGQTQSFDPSLFDAMKWRMIGPFRAGRTVGAVGVAQQPNVFYMGVNHGGVWKTNDYGRTWKPIFDDQPTGSVGDVAVAPSNPNVIYVASGEGIQRPDLSIGDGIYKSTDGGKTWLNTGIRDGQQIGGLSIDPGNENKVFAAVLGHPYGANTERGVFRTKDGGKTWEKVLYVDENTGAAQVTIDPKNSDIVYADLWAARQGPWENGAWQGPGSGLFKSTDGGTTWKKLTKGLPTFEQGLGRIGFCIAPSDPNRLYATVDSGNMGGIYRSDDGGESWYRTTSDQRIWSRGSDFAEVKVDPFKPDVVYSANVVVWKSTDGGKTWTGIKGAPGGDDYHRIWINPNNSNIILLGLDQGATISVNGGETWSSWYNQPTAQFYHVSTDNAFPYNVYGGQQESGSAMVASRSNDGQITEWHPVGVEEYGYVAADPLDPNIVYGGKITRYDKRTGQVQNISPEAVRTGKYRFIRTAPVLFSPIDPHTLYFSGNVIFKTTNGGNSWEVISPDLTREAWDVPDNIGVYKNPNMKTMPRRGVVYTIAPSYKDINTIWAGTDDGYIQVTGDGGKTWRNVTPPAITSWMKVSIMEASHTDVNTAYAAVNAIRLDDMKPHIFRTRDGGKTWQEIVKGLPDSPINTVKEDPMRPGLLFAGSEKSVHVSFDDGENWQSLKLNMPATSIRDLVIKDDDVVIGTHGRSFWILDDITPLRQVNTSVAASVFTLYKPQSAWRVRWNMWPDTPLPPEEPAGQNPPDGAIINYYLKSDAKNVTLEILDNAGTVLRKYSSQDQPYAIPEVNIPLYWIRPQQILSARAGSHRFLWDIRLTPLDVEPSYPISATYMNTAPEATAPWLMPGTYQVKLTVDGNVQTQSLTVRMDPRVTTSTADLQLQYDLASKCYNARKSVVAAVKEIQSIRSQVGDRKASAKGTVIKSLDDADQQLQKLARFSWGSSDPTLGWLDFSLASLFSTLEDADLPPTAQAKAAVGQLEGEYNRLMPTWKQWKEKSLPALNAQLKKSGLKAIQ